MRQLLQQELEMMKTMLKIKKNFSPEKEKLETAIYARKSTEDIHATSIPTQIAECRALIAQNADLLHISEEHIYKEDGKSGMFMDNRDSLQEMLSEIRKKKIDVVILYHHDRLTRRIEDFEAMKRELEQLKVLIVFGDIYYENTPMGEFFESMMFGVSQLEVRTAADKTAKTLRSNVARGQSAGGRAPYGLKCVGKQFFIEESEAPAIKLMFNIVERGGSYDEILQEFDARNIRTRTGRRFSYSTISDLLRNWKFAGIYVYCRKDRYGNPVNKKRRRVLLGEQEEIRNDKTVVETIVPKKQFLKVQELLDGRTTGNKKSNADEKYLLSGLVYCECGGHMYGESTRSNRGQRRYRYYSCDNSRKKKECTAKKISANKLEEFVKRAVAAEITKFVQSGGLSAEKLKSLQCEIQKEIGFLSRRISDTQGQNVKLAERSVNTDIEEVIKTYERKIANNEYLIDRLTARKNSQETKTASIEKFRQNPKTIQFKKSELFPDPETASKLIALFVEKIVVGEKEIKLTMYS